MRVGFLSLKFRKEFILHTLLFLLLSLLFTGLVFANNNAYTINSSITVSSTSVPADGSTTATISVTVQDSLKNKLAGDHVTLTSTKDSGLTINGGAVGSGEFTAATDSNGNVTFTVSSSNPSPGTVTFTAKDTSDSPPVNLGSVNITFTASALAPKYSCTDGAPGSTSQLTSAVANSSNQITLTWTDASNPVSLYLIAYGISAGQYIYGNPNVGRQGTTSYTVGSLSVGTKYYFAVKAVNGCKPGSFSNELSATTKGGIIVNTPTPTQTQTQIQTPSVDTSLNTSIKDTITPTATPAPSQNVESTPAPAPKQSLIGGVFASKIFDAFVGVFVFVVIGGFVYWKRKKGRDKSITDIEKNQLQENLEKPNPWLPLIDMFRTRQIVLSMENFPML